MTTAVKAPQACADPFCQFSSTPCGWSAPEHLNVPQPLRKGPPTTRPRPAPTLAPASSTPAGPPSSTLAIVRGLLEDYDAQRPRSVQVELGPSELGTECVRQIGMKLAGVPEVPAGLKWAPVQGTAIHTLMESVLNWHNSLLDRPRWVVEDNLHIADDVIGHGDAYDLDTDSVVDWKHAGKTTIAAIKRKTVPNHLLIKPDYRVQAHLYGLGHTLAGRPVKWVRVVFLPRTHDFDDGAEWTEAYDPQVAHEAIERYRRIKALVGALDLLNNPAMLPALEATPGKACEFCPFRRFGGPVDLTGCPGDTTTKVSKQLAGIIPEAA